MASGRANLSSAATLSERKLGALAEAEEARELRILELVGGDLPPSNVREDPKQKVRPVRATHAQHAKRHVVANDGDVSGDGWENFGSQQERNIFSPMKKISSADAQPSKLDKWEQEIKVARRKAVLNVGMSLHQIPAPNHNDIVITRESSDKNAVAFTIDTKIDDEFHDEHKIRALKAEQAKERLAKKRALAQKAVFPYEGTR